MSLSCFLFGHDFAEAGVEREREERGSEVVVTIREVEACSQCGTERVVSQNKEVTTLETEGDEADAEQVATADGNQERERATDSEGERDAGPTTATDASAGDSGGAAAAGSATVERTESTEPETDDGIILDEGPDTNGERATGEWPQEADSEAISDADEDTGWTPETSVAAGAESPDPDPEPGPEILDGDIVTVPEGEFYCPECGFTTAVESSSLREGDFCPECHRGSLAHRTSE